MSKDLIRHSRSILGYQKKLRLFRTIPVDLDLGPRSLPSARFGKPIDRNILALKTTEFILFFVLTFDCVMG